MNPSLYPGKSRVAPLTREDRLQRAFPEVDPGVKPLGSRLLVQIRRAPKTTASGNILLTEESKDTEKWNTQIAKVLALGPIAFHNRNTMTLWPEGKWCSPGDFVRVPKYAGDRWEVAIPGEDNEHALFAIFNDLDIIGLVTGDPLVIKAYV